MFVTMHTCEVDRMVFKREDTYIIVCTALYGDSDRALSYLKKRKDIKILFESALAVNKRPGHGTKPRNKIVVFEYEPDNV